MIYPRFVTNFKPAGTKSYRLAASQLLGFGGNAQNPAECLLDLLQSRNGHSFVQPDQSGADSAVVANLAPPGLYKELLDAGEKPHTFLALHLFAKTNPGWFQDIGPAELYLQEKIPARLVTIPGWTTLSKRIGKSGKPYKVGKMVVHASSYGMGWNTFRNNALKQSAGEIVLSAPEAKEFLSMFHKLFPEIQQWQNEVIFQAKKTRVLYNLFGYPRRFERIFNPSYEREIISWIPQSTVGCLTTEAIFKMEDYITQHKKQWNLLSNKHDSFLYEVPDSEIEECCTISTESIGSLKLIGRGGIEFRMKSGIKKGRNWGDYHEANNPNGMK